MNKISTAKATGVARYLVDGCVVDDLGVQEVEEVLVEHARWWLLLGICDENRAEKCGTSVFVYYQIEEGAITKVKTASQRCKRSICIKETVCGQLATLNTYSGVRSNKTAFDFVSHRF